MGFEPTLRLFDANRISSAAPSTSPLKFISDEFPTYIASAERNFHAMCSLRYSVSYISYVHRFRGAELSCDVLLNSIQNLHTFFKSLIL